MASPATALATPSPAPTSRAPRRCFICLTDQDACEPDSLWVNPCPCTLEAHHDCMLSWVTDCERTNKPLVCPVCKHHIDLDGPWDPVVALDDAIRARFSRSSPYVLCTAVFVGVHFSLQLYGAMAMSVFAGKEPMIRYLVGNGQAMDARALVKQRMKNFLVLTNVAPTLVATEMLPALSNYVFLPMASLYGMYHVARDDHFLTWPPSPQLVISLFPYVRSVYNTLYWELVSPYEIKLNRQLLGLPAVRPQQGDGNQPQQRQDEGLEQPGGLLGFLQVLRAALDPDMEDGEEEVGIEGNIQIVEEEAVEEDGAAEPQIVMEVAIQEVNEQEDGEVAENANAMEIRIGGDDPAAQDDNAQGNHEAPRAPPRRLGLMGILSNFSDRLVGALLLPGISYMVGEALHLVLPKSWTSPAFVHPFYGLGSRPWARPGLLQQQWGRSLVGGCLFVVVRDVMRVYAKHRRVGKLGQRRVKNVKRSGRD